MTYFGPLPQRGPFDYDGLTRWLSGETVSFESIITGSLQAGQILSSANFVSGSVGWQIDGDGNAEFNDVTIRGDIISGNWDGSDPLDLSAIDADATQGFALDSSEGVIQIMAAFLYNVALLDGQNDNTHVGNLAGLNDEVIMYTNSGKDLRIAVAGAARIHIDGQGTSDILFRTGNTDRWVMGPNNGHLTAQGNQAVRAGAGAEGAPSLSFAGDTDTGFYSAGTNLIGFTTNGTLAFTLGGGNNLIGASNFIIRVGAGAASAPSYSFENDTDTGMYRNGTGRIGFAVEARMAFEIRTNSDNPDLYMFENFDNVGNVETLRAVRNGSGTDVTKIGYNSSFLFDKEGNALKLHVQPVAEKKWKREWFMDIEPISYRHKVSHGIKEIKQRIPGYQPDEFGFSIENVSKHTNMLTTQGNQQGPSIDEKAILAVTVDYVQHLEQRVAELEARCQS